MGTKEYVETVYFVATSVCDTWNFSTARLVVYLGLMASFISRAGILDTYISYKETSVLQRT